MRMEEAIRIIMNANTKKYRVHFEKIDGTMLRTDYFPERYEEPIKTEKEAWALAVAFAQKTKGDCVNIYVVDEKWCPVPGYKEKLIQNR